MCFSGANNGDQRELIYYLLPAPFFMGVVIAKKNYIYIFLSLLALQLIDFTQCRYANLFFLFTRRDNLLLNLLTNLQSKSTGNT